QVVHLSYLKEVEARQLVECPVKDFSLRYEPNASRRVLDLTQCHPYLVQLLCAEIVALKNEQDPSVRRLARLVDVEAVVPEALIHGSLFFADIERNQAELTRRWFVRSGI
ncbi:MAG: ATP-binding protein, partial [Candidatus Binatia bacterium]